MTAKAKIEAPKGRTQRPTWRAPIYPERGIPFRVAIDRARINSIIVRILRKTAKFPPELAHGRHNDAE